jgi:hypothetical protein
VFCDNHEDACIWKQTAGRRDAGICVSGKLRGISAVAYQLPPTARRTFIK